MVKGLFTSWTGMANEQKRLDVITNNLANAATTGYKKDGVTNQSFRNLLTYKVKDMSENYTDKQIGKMSLGVKIGEVYTNYDQGSFRSTGNTFDFAIQGKGFFNVSTTDKNGNEVVKYTRDGSFTMDQSGKLVDVNGNTLMGEGGEITIPDNTANVKVDENGGIYADGVFVDKIKLTDFTDYSYLKKQGDSFYLAQDGATQLDSTAKIQQGYTEQSNVNVVAEMTSMIAITRAYEANQKVIQTIDGTLDLAANSVGKV
ncbi:flagellar basal-body rod protein FlgF [Anaerocolumna xylanovorans]|uniref:Flagellar basal-body rod protein FlgG n=1 Tax=Anaerocolumna xylanovorans DSM 12503 TaxID=1121345 RepID=A0A1M7YA48_9FIRM|nr:flagellar basal-body rod protein FlgF [Anaerocolumna xylanovorans]SHO49469.1 flagellar basal-body rod protein FlgG [Anaerocolumna xylanovorans DSM 12503]